jgi:hypothetical protein
MLYRAAFIRTVTFIYRLCSCTNRGNNPKYNIVVEEILAKINGNEEVKNPSNLNIDIYSHIHPISRANK